MHAAVVAGDEPDTALLLEHAAVYTAGKRTEPHERPFDGTPVIDVDRGGKITWHGPGQLVGYPIVRLPVPIDVVAHVRRLEEVMIRVCADFGVDRRRVEGRSGVWVRADEPRPRPQDRRHRHPGEPERHHARFRAQLRLRPVLGRRRSCRAASRTPASPRSARSSGRVVTVREVLPYAEKHLGDVLG